MHLEKMNETSYFLWTNCSRTSLIEFEDIVYRFLLMPIAITGVILNAINLLVLRDKSLKGISYLLLWVISVELTYVTTNIFPCCITVPHWLWPTVSPVYL